MPTALICGLFVMVIGLSVSRQMLVWMDTPPEVMNQAVLYIRLYFLGIPASMIYNFGAAAFRAVGDARRPLIFLAISGVVNVGLNIVFVTQLGWGVAGVATATIISQMLSAAMTVVSMCRYNGWIRFEQRKMHIYGDKLREMIRIGLPVGLQNSLFSISNVLVQSSINSFGASAMAAHTAAVSIEGFMNASVAGVFNAAMNFSAQNAGAGKYTRIKKTCGICCAAVMVITMVLGSLMLIFARQLLALYDPDPVVIELGLNRIYIIGFTYWLFGLMNVFAGCLRGMGRSMLPMLASLLGICGLRIVYIYTIFRMSPTLFTLYLCYPASWLTAMLANLVSYYIVSRLLIKHARMEGRLVPDTD